ncbi:MAG: ribosome recycling factor [Dehalococcoidales bacterium]|jgi:ribosome recycling factor|nr:ribosome recycling factor [Dehalococcoidales bacterium]MDP6043297.1 ribosome recycling factor [Dehalococcoidales bacterium]MDP6449153.1 ribosome recycling factor [Dehalococcoidales bacterium]MDP7416158.1 ribosome recycling factor [Dehalococcoidales bacterium]
MISDTLRNAEEKMRISLGGLKKELSTVRTGRAAPALVEHIKVEYAGVPTPLNQIAGISAPEARMLVIQPWDKSGVHNIEKAILQSDLGLNPSTSGDIIRINIPQLSEERRQELIKAVRRRVEERRIAARNLRHEAMNELKGLEKDKEISQDEHKRALHQLQQLTDLIMVGIEQIGQDKEVELKEV